MQARILLGIILVAVLAAAGPAFASGTIADVQAQPSAIVTAAVTDYQVDFFIQNELRGDAAAAGDKIVLTFPTGTTLASLVIGDITVNGTVLAGPDAVGDVANVVTITLATTLNAVAPYEVNPGEIRIAFANTRFTHPGAATGLSVSVETQETGGATIDAAGTSQTFDVVAAGVELTVLTHARTGGNIPGATSAYTVGFTTSVGAGPVLADSVIIDMPTGTDLSGVTLANITVTDAGGGGLAGGAGGGFDAISVSGNHIGLRVLTPQGGVGAVTIAFDVGALEVVNPLRARVNNYATVKLVTTTTVNEIGYTPTVAFGDPLADAIVTMDPINLVVSETAADTFAFTTSAGLTAANDVLVIRFSGGEWDILGAEVGSGTVTQSGTQPLGTHDLDIIARTDSTLTLETTAGIGLGLQVLHITGVVAPSTASSSHWIGIRAETSAGVIDEGEQRVFVTAYAAPEITFTTPAPAATSATTDAGADFTLAYTLTDPLGDLGVAAQIFNLYVSADPTLNITVQGGGAGRAFDNTPVVLDATVGGTNATGSTVNTSNLTEGEWYVYAVMAGTGDVSRGRSGAITVTHPPFVNSVDPASAITLDSGDAAFQDNDQIDFDIDDFDDDADVNLFYSSNSTLTSSEVTTTGTSPSITITGLTGATLVAGSDTLKEDDSNNILWNIFTNDSTFVTGATYTVYAVATDGKSVGFGTSADNYTVRHSPEVTLSAPAAGTFDSGTAESFMVAWHGTNGDTDIDDNATISIYYSDFAVTGLFPDGATGATNLLAALTEDNTTGAVTITTGLSEDADGGTNDQYVWSLPGFAAPPVDGTTINVYAIIDDGSTQVLDGSIDVVWSNASNFQFTGPIASGISIDLGTKIKIPFKLRDLQATPDRFYIVASTVVAPPANGGALTVAVGGDSWIINVPDATTFLAIPAGTGATAATDVDTFVVWDTTLDYGNPDGALLTSVAHDIYAFLDDGDGIPNVGDVLAATAPGQITLTGTGGTLPTRDLSITPNNVVVEAGEDLTFDIVPNTSGKNVTLFSYYLSVDTSAVTITDLNAPFTVGSAFSTWTVLRNKATVVGDKYQLDFVLFDNTGLVPDGTQTLATLTGTAQGVASGSGLSPFNIFFDTDPANNRETALFDGGTQLGISLPSPALTVTSAPRGTIQGKVPLEGRPLDFSKQITFELRPTGSFESVSDTQFIDANDEDTSATGIQVTTNTTGDYTLSEVPAGVFSLVALTDLYLSGQVSVTMSANEALTNVRPTEDNASVDRNELFAGDANADNLLDTDDVNVVFNAFGTSFGDALFDTNVDFDGDSSVTITDLSLISGHTSGGSTPQGVDPVFKPVEDGLDALFALAGLPQRVKKGQTFEVVVSLENGENIRGFNFDLMFDSNIVKPVMDASYVAGYLGPESLSMVRESRNGAVVAVNIQQGRPAGVNGTGEVAVLRFEAVADGRPGVSLNRGFTIDPEDKVSTVALGMVNGNEVERADFTLDGSVDLADYALLMENMGSSQVLFDLTSDGAVDSRDREAFASTFTTSSDVQGIPMGALEVSLVEENLKPNSIASIEVRLSEVPLVKAFEFELTYDADRFEYISNGLVSNALTSGEAYRVQVSEDGGKLLVVNALSSAQAVSEDNLVSQLQFRVKGEFDRAEPFSIARGVLVDGRDIFAPLAGLGSLEAVTIPTAFSLYQNYPNPFNPETTIRYDLAADTQVNLRIFNVLGQVIHTVVSERQTAGRYTAVWNGKDKSGHQVSSGVYFYRIDAGSFKDQKRMMLLK
jgi:hypothetical protein